LKRQFAGSGFIWKWLLKQCMHDNIIAVLLIGRKKCMEYEVEGPRPSGRPKNTWREFVEKDCQARKLNKEDAIDCSR